jgi:membrane protease YdiL (CAAX protease family)
MDSRLNTKRILVFLAFAFGVPWTAALVLYLTIGMEDMEKAQGLANNIAIATPWLANLAARLITKEGWRHLMLRPNFRRGWQSYLAAWLLPPVLIIGGGVVFYLLFPLTYDANLTLVRKDMSTSPLLSGMTNPWVGLLITLLLIMTIEVPIRAIPTLGEEFGWRAYLLPKLVKYFAGRTNENPSQSGNLNAASVRKAALLVGLIHGVWHWPLMLMAASLIPWVPVLSLLLYLVFTCSLSVLLSWVTLRSDSVWPAMIVHGLLGRIINLTLYPLQGTGIPLVGPDPTGLIGGLGFTLLALMLLYSRKAYAGINVPGSVRESVTAGA